jgi:hypothetical protein
MANMAKRVIGNLQFNLEDFHLKVFAGSDLSIGVTCHTWMTQMMSALRIGSTARARS